MYSNENPGRLRAEVRWSASGSDTATLLTGIDEALDIVRISAGGLWDADTSDRFFAVQEPINALARARRPQIRVLFDLTKAIPQMSNSAERITLGNRTLYQPQDRIALVVPSMLVRLQLRRMFSVGVIDFFTDPQAAIAWLLSDEKPTE